MKDVCARCNKELARLPEIHVVEGSHYCSKECAINSQVDVIIDSAKDIATEWYNAGAEIVTPKDIGIVFDRIWTAYSADADVTTIFYSKHLDKEYNEVISTEVLGFYFGEPNEIDTKEYIGDLKAEY